MAALPVVLEGERVVWVDEWAPSLLTGGAGAAAAEVLALDVECARDGRPALAQIAVGERLVLLVDLLAVDAARVARDLARRAAAAPLLVHGGAGDLRALPGFEADCVVELNDLARPRLRHVGVVGLQKLCRQLLHARLLKHEQRSDWTRRPLTEAQRHYAALDALVLVRLWNALGKPPLAAFGRPYPFVGERRRQGRKRARTLSGSGMEIGIAGADVGGLAIEEVLARYGVRAPGGGGGGGAGGDDDGAREGRRQRRRRRRVFWSPLALHWAGQPGKWLARWRFVEAGRFA